MLPTLCAQQGLYIGRVVVSPVVGCWHVICLVRDADLHMAQLMPLPLASVKSGLVLRFWYRLTRVDPEKEPLNRCVCVCGCQSVCLSP